MRKISEIKNIESMKTWAKLFKPCKVLVGNKELLNSIKEQDFEKVCDIIAENDDICENLIRIFAIIDDVPYDDYELSFIEVPGRLIELLNDDRFMAFFR